MAPSVVELQTIMSAQVSAITIKFAIKLTVPRVTSMPAAKSCCRHRKPVIFAQQRKSPLESQKDYIETLMELDESQNENLIFAHGSASVVCIELEPLWNRNAIELMDIQMPLACR